MQTHTVHTGDSLPAIAARYYGDASRWRDLVVANNLRPPYISTDPLDAFGDLQSTAPLVTEATAGSRVLLVAPTTLVRVGAQLVLYVTASDGTAVIRATTVEQANAGALTLTTPLPQTVRAGTPVLLFPPASEVRGAVAQPGTVLRIPDTDAAPASAPPTPTASDNRYLRDLAAVDGRLVLINGDLALAAGLTNLQQQLSHRMRSEQGALYRHPTYGTSVYSYVGQASTPTLALLVQAALALAVARDPRVAAVERVDADAAGDVVTATVVVRAAQDTTTLTLTVTR